MVADDVDDEEKEAEVEGAHIAMKKDTSSEEGKHTTGTKIRGKNTKTTIEPAVLRIAAELAPVSK